MKFNKIEYTRPDIKQIEDKFNSLLKIFDSADNFEIQDAIMKDINYLRMEFQTMNTLASIKYTIETTNAEYENEQNFFDTITPIYEGLVTRYYRSIIKSKFRQKLEENK